MCWPWFSWMCHPTGDQEVAGSTPAEVGNILSWRAGLGGSVGCASDWRPGGRGFDPRRGRQHSFVEIDHEIFSTVILSLPLIQEGQLSVSGERMCTILVNRLEDKACPVNVWLGKLTALDMTPLGWLGRKTSTQTNSLVEIDHEIFSTVILSLPLIQEGQLSVSGERMCAILVNRLED